MANESNNPGTSTDSWVGKGVASGLEDTQADRDRNVTASQHPGGEGTVSGMAGTRSETGQRDRGLGTEFDASADQSTNTGAFNDWETSANPMIASNRVEGTAVYNASRDRLGTIQHIMIDKLSGQSEFAVMSFGGFLGIGSDYYPIPWNKLTYDTEMGGYVVDLTQDQLTGAPKYRDDENPEYNADYTGEIGRYYGL
jgi:hypothetical protein